MPQVTVDATACTILSYKCKYDWSDNEFSGLCGEDFFDEQTGVVDAMGLVNPDFYAPIKYPKTVDITIDTVTDDTVSNQNTPGRCKFSVNLDPCTDEILSAMTTKRAPFPFAD